MDIADNPVEAARKAAGLSLSGLANRTGIPRTTLRRKLGHPLELTLSELDDIAAATGRDSAALFQSLRTEAA